MTSPEGAFYTAFDAEVDAQEGLSYLWTTDEIESLLGVGDAKLFNQVYGVDQGPNFADPHHGNGHPDKNILYLPRPMEFAAKAAGLSVEQLESRLAPMRQVLYAARLKRKQPLLDTKILTSWNALMIRAMAYAGKILDDARYTEAARRASRFLLEKHRSTSGGLYRTSRDGKAKYDGFLDDYAFLIQALLEVGDDSSAENLAVEMTRRFADESASSGFYFTQAGAADLIVRQKTASDSPLPSGNAVAAMVMLQLGRNKFAREVIETFAQHLDASGEGMSSMAQAAMEYVRTNGAIEVTAAAQSQDNRPLSPQEMAQSVVTLGAAFASPTELHVRISIRKGFHIHSNTPSKGMIATTVAVSGVEAGAIEYPLGIERKFAFADESLSVYEGQVEVVLELNHAPQGEFRLSVSYQACDDSSCLPPVTKVAEIAVS